MGKEYLCFAGDWDYDEDRILEMAVFRSMDEGKTWSKQGPNKDGYVSAIAVDPINTEIMFAGAQEFNYNGGYFKGQLYKTTNGGIEWNNIGKSIFDFLYINSILVDPKDSQWIYVGTDKGFFKSTDRGENWQNYVEDKSINCIISGKQSETNLLIGTDKGV